MAISIISRARWGARPARSVSRCSWATATRLWVHHSEGTTPADDLQAEIAVVRGIQSFHQGHQRGWSDIGYGFLVAPSGRIFEGRGEERWAAHCPGYNDEPSVCLLGRYGTEPPSDAAIDAVWSLADHLGLGSLIGHRAGIATSCPGDAAMAHLVDAARPSGRPAVDAARLPYGPTLRLHIQTSAERRAGRRGRSWAGWDEAAGPLVWIRRHRLAPTTTCAISWRGRVWRGHRDVAAVAATLANRFGL